MADFNKRFTSKKQEWTTPSCIFDKLNEEFNFTLDLAADKFNTKCVKFYDEDSNSLIQKWTGVCWLNPPYGNSKYKLLDFIKKSHLSSQEDKCVVVALISARTNTKWWHEYCMKAAEIRFICGRPKFGNADYGLPLPLAIVIFKKHDIDTIFSSFYVK
jgi:phage N-6-adenine-methyltransferase